ncbi:MAG TPA: YceD family protein, partial [Woeseiaceae bacterium]|nr:YceD family protein [Woeseiaceae bacterium]
RATPKAFAERGQVIEKTEKLAIFPRLSEVVATDLRCLGDETAMDEWRQAPVAFRLAFGWADTEQELPVLEGHAAAEIPAVCQRCLERFELSLDTDFRLLFSGPGGRADESLEYEVWELDEPALRPLDVLDEALVMAMPFATVHASESECGPLAERAKIENEVSVRPFADLKSQLREKR